MDLLMLLGIRVGARSQWLRPQPSSSDGMPEWVGWTLLAVAIYIGIRVYNKLNEGKSRG